jgi:hypothetical protein
MGYTGSELWKGGLRGDILILKEISKFILFVMLEL